MSQQALNCFSQGIALILPFSFFGNHEKTWNITSTQKKENWGGKGK